MKTFSDRLKHALKHSGMTQIALAKAVGIAQPTVHKLLQPKAQGSSHVAKIAHALGVSPLWLEAGTPPMLPASDVPRMIAVAGYVGAGAEVHAIDDHVRGAGIDEAPPPPGFEGSCVAVKVRGDSMYPLLDDGWVLYYANEHAGVSDDAVGRLCVAKTVDGTVFVKRLRRGSRKGLWRLESLNAPPIEDVKLEWAAPIIAMRAP